MKNILLILSFLLGIIILAASCSRNETDEQCESPLNPNGDSELAILMRQMAKHLETEKALLASGQAHGEYPVEFEKIRTAKPTESKRISEHFDSYAVMYVDALKKYHQSGGVEESKTAFNNLVTSCISCHKNECPGPIKRIEKNYISLN